ncbi:MAG: hypothetical protein JNL10_22500 [Verrucomicrobiales bacterium]|nr:hypothetical protein [Verrucomicrobiales bacterium]
MNTSFNSKRPLQEHRWRAAVRFPMRAWFAALVLLATAAWFPAVGAEGDPTPLLLKLRVPGEASYEQVPKDVQIRGFIELPAGVSAASARWSWNRGAETNLVVDAEGGFDLLLVDLPEDLVLVSVVVSGSDGETYPGTLRLNRLDRTSDPSLKLSAFFTEATTDENRPLFFIPISLEPFGSVQGAVISVKVVGGTATPGLDFTQESDRLVLAPGESQAVARFEILDDLEDEPEETIRIQLSILEPAGSTNEPVFVDVRIQDNEGPGPVGIISGRLVANEAAGVASVRLVRRGNFDIEGSVDYRVEGDEALVAALGPAREGTARFGRGESQTVVSLPIPNDFVTQTKRELAVRISNPQGGLFLGEITETRVTVRDDDSPPPFFIEKLVEYEFNNQRGVYGSLATERGFRYLIEYADSPVSESWTLLSTVYGNNSSQSFWDSTESNTARFYRYRVENELLTILGD